MNSLLLVTGATGKVGQQFLRRFLADGRFAHFKVRAMCHNRTLPEAPRVEVFRGSIEHQSSVSAAMEGVTHVVHLATCKETPDAIMDVAVKGLFWLLESSRTSA